MNLADIKAAHERVKKAEHELQVARDDRAAAVHLARAQLPGLSWEEIGRALGMSRQGAHQMFGGSR